MLRYSQYRLTEVSRNDTPAVPTTPTRTRTPTTITDLKGLEAYLVRAIDGYVESLKATLSGQVRDSMRQNRGMMGKLKNWWGNWMNGTTGESVENLPIEMAAFADEQLLRELNIILEGPIDQTLAQMTKYLDALKSKLIAAVRNGIAQVNRAAAPQPPAPQPTPTPSITDKDLEPHSATASGDHGGHTSRFQTGLPSFGHAVSTADEFPSDEPAAAPEPEAPTRKLLPGQDSETGAITHGISPTKIMGRRRKKAVPPDSIAPPEPEAPPEEPAVEPPPEPEAPPEVAPEVPKARRRKAKFLGDTTPEQEREKHERSPIKPYEVKDHGKILRHYPPEAKAAYEAEQDPYAKRQMAGFLASIQGPTIDALAQSKDVGQILNWIKAYDPKEWPKLGVNLPTTANVLGNHHSFTDWADWVLQETISHRTAALIEQFRRRRLSR